MKKTAFVFLFLVFAQLSLFAQDYEYLEKVKLKNDSDFIKNEKTILDCVNFLTINRVDQARQNRVYCNRFNLQVRH